MLLKQIAEIIKGDLQGDSTFEVQSIAAMPDQASQDQLAMVFPAKFSRAGKAISKSSAQAFVLAKALHEEEEFQELFEENKSKNFIFVDRPKYALKLLLPYFADGRFEPQGVHASAVIESDVELDSSVSVGALSYIAAGTTVGSGTQIHSRVSIGKNCEIGSGCIFHSGVVIEDYVKIGDRVEIHPNSVIGADGYSYITEEPSNLEKLQKGDFNFAMDRQIQHKIISAGSVVIEDDVEIGACTCIDRGSIAPTKIGQGTKIDNLCQIAHNVQIGKDCLIVAQTGIAGSAKIGDRVTLAGASGCGDGVEIGNDVAVGAFSAVNSNIDPFLPVVGIPAVPYGEFMRRQRAITRLPKQQEEIRRMKSKIEELNRKK